MATSVHMVSTTNTEEEIKEALGRRVPGEPQEVAAAATAVGEETKETDSQEKSHKKGGYQRKIEKLEAQLAAERTGRQELLDRLAGKPAEPKQEAKPADDAKPQLDKFKTYEDFVEALTSWTVKQEAKKYAEQQVAAEATEIEQQIEAEYQGKVDAFKAAHPDFEEVMDTDVSIYMGVERAIKEMDTGPEVAYFLAKNPEVAAKLMEMTPLKAITEVGKIAQKLAKPESPAKPKSAAPAPITPVGGGSAVTSTGSPGKRSLQEYRRLREEGRI